MEKHQNRMGVDAVFHNAQNLNSGTKTLLDVGICRLRKSYQQGVEKFSTDPLPVENMWII